MRYPANGAALVCHTYEIFPCGPRRTDLDSRKILYTTTRKLRFLTLMRREYGAGGIDIRSPCRSCFCDLGEGDRVAS